MDLSEVPTDCVGRDAHRPQRWGHSCHQRGAVPRPSSLIRNGKAAGTGAAQLYTDGWRWRTFHRRDRTRKKKNITIRKAAEAT